MAFTCNIPHISLIAKCGRVHKTNAIGVISELKHENSQLSFCFGRSIVTIGGINQVPDWLTDGTIVEIDFKNNTITKHTQILA